MSGEQVLRAAVLKQMHGWSYADLTFSLADSPTFRTFCRIGMVDEAPKKATLAYNIKLVKPETMEAVNKLIIGRANKERIEDGKRVRIDSTVIDANIHHPLDSNLLFDVVRVLTRILGQSEGMSSRIEFSDHTKRAKRRMLDVINARSMAARVPLYRELVEVTRWTMAYAAKAGSILKTLSNPSARAAADLLEHYIDLGKKVIDQTERRVFHEESVPAAEKVVSIFEPHADVIVKDRRETLYGHKVFLNVGASGMVLDMLLERGNPSDATRAITMLERHRDLLGEVPEQAAFDAGFTSAANIENARQLGVEGASFAKKGTIDVLAGVHSPKQHKKLQRFRAGAEGIISFTKRCFASVAACGAVTGRFMRTHWWRWSQPTCSCWPDKPCADPVRSLRPRQRPPLRPPVQVNAEIRRGLGETASCALQDRSQSKTRPDIHRLTAPRQAILPA